MSGRHYAAEDRKSGAVTHLAHARIQNRRPGILGNLFERIIEIFFVIISICSMDSFNLRILVSVRFLLLDLFHINLFQ
ncbi:hypothetical protein GCM10023142_13870 [Anaerocolumna aminovalerica]